MATTKDYLNLISDNISNMDSYITDIILLSNRNIYRGKIGYISDGRQDFFYHDCSKMVFNGVDLICEKLYFYRREDKTKVYCPIGYMVQDECNLKMTTQVRKKVDKIRNDKTKGVSV